MTTFLKCHTGRVPSTPSGTTRANARLPFLTKWMETKTFPGTGVRLLFSTDTVSASLKWEPISQRNSTVPRGLYRKPEPGFEYKARGSSQEYDGRFETIAILS